LIDAAIRIFIYIILGLILNALGDFGEGLLLIIVFFIEWFYPVLFEVLYKGMTPGKKTLGLQVLNGDGTPVIWSASLLRNILRTVDFLPLLYGVGLVSMLMSNRFQRLGDLAADTIVVYTNTASILPEIPYYSVLKPAYEFNLKEQQAIIRYAERSTQLSDQRLDELAGILDPVDVAQHRMTREKLLGIANGLIGRQ